MKQHLRTAFRDTTITEIVDSETGEITKGDIQVKNYKYLAGDSEAFYLAYVSLLNHFSFNLSLPEVQVYCQLLLTYNSNTEFALVKALKQTLANKIDIKLGTLNNSLSGLVEKGLLISKSRGVYQLNPRYAYQGSTKDRAKQLKVVLEFNPKL